MTQYHYILYCPTTNSFVFEERKDSLQYTDMDTAEQFSTLREARSFNLRCEAAGFPPLQIQKIKTTTKVVARYEK